MHTPVPAGLPVVRFTDKVVHFFLYLLLTVLGGRWCAVAKGAVRVETSPDQAAPTRTAANRITSTRARIVLASVFVLYAAFDEWLQQFVGRSMSAGDFAADAAGVATATTFLVWWGRRRPISPAQRGPPG